MRIVLVNWARIEDGAASGGGVNGYCQGLALELVRRGHEVVSVCGGSEYEGRGAGPRVRPRGDWRGVRVYEVVNSPVLAPSLAQFREPLGEVGAPGLEEAVRALMAELRPDVVHFHNIEGFSAGCIGAVRAGAPGARVVFSLHNYHTVCPQVYLMQGHRRPCFSFDHGRCCEGCIPARTPAEVRREREGERGVLGLVRRASRAIAPAPAAPAPAPHPDRWSEAWFGMPARRALLNVVSPEPRSETPPNAYALRRGAMLAMLNSCDAVLAVSRFVAEKFAVLGVDPSRLRSVHIGTRFTEIVEERRGELGPPPPLARGERPVRVAFMGYNNYYKGLPMLIESLEMIAPEYLSRIHLTVLALGGEVNEPELRALEPRLAGLTLEFGYRQEDLPRMIGGCDLGLVTSVWWDNGPQTVLEFLACGVPVLGAELGGIPDFVREGENGLLFRGNDRWDLSRRLVEIVRSPAVLDRLRAGVRPPKGMREHGAEIEAVYAGGPIPA
jgi:glycosyltransferase involved in cell wall biosynthesis